MGKKSLGRKYDIQEEIEVGSEIEDEVTGRPAILKPKPKFRSISY